MIYWPHEFPCWLLENHEGQDEDIYARTEMDVGVARLRRMYRRVPHVRKAELFLHGNQPALFHEFFEETLDRGTYRFTAPFLAREGSVRYYECEFVQPYDAEFVLLRDAERAWRVKCEFRLYKGSLDSGELRAALLNAEFGIRLNMQGTIKPTSMFHAEFGIDLHGVVGRLCLNMQCGIPLRMRVTPENQLPGVVVGIALSGNVS